MARIIIGNSTEGYSTANVTFTKTGKARLVKGTENGTKSTIRKCIANYNKGFESYVTSAGDEKPFVIEK